MPPISKKKEDKGYCRSEDIERLAKLEWVVYENHHARLEKQEELLEITVKNQTQINNHFKIIKYAFLTFLIGATGSTIGWTNVGQLLTTVIGI